MTKDEFLAELANTLNEDSLAEDQDLKTVADFDSTGVLGIIAMISGKLKVKVNLDAIRDAQKVGDLVKLVEEKLT